VNYKLSNNLQAKTDIYFQPNLKTPAFPLPKVNVCELTANYRAVPIVSDIVGIIEKFGNSTGLTRCPTVIGSYRMVDMYVDDKALFTDLIWLKRNSKYMVHLVIQDENGKKPQLVHSVKYYLIMKPLK
jgi:hypothetical protein